ncbi:related to nuclear division protein Rft1 [Pseudozyma flocculosa]|uniref:Man(5)GlcNAc(2)-PP-dolichol translocation protein RFT1 n=1 Tax=Pseudozyma flocculosa TaxID=84751 RepID=A0A5C3EXM9_9BASI|nr:related to nuclear division protein Rft1 [Pseudozyma flocculosa]
MSARLLTFVLNQLLVRLVPANVFGAANIQLELLLSTILFLSREAIRNVLIRPQQQQQQPFAEQSDSVKDGPQEKSGPKDGSSRRARASRDSVHNVSLLPIPFGLLLSLVVGYVYVHHLSPASLREAATFKLSVSLYVLGALAELVSEPLHIRSLALGNPALRVQAEGVAIFVKCVTSIGAVVALPALMERGLISGYGDAEKSMGLLAFGIGQVCYGLAILLVYTQWFLRRFGHRATFGIYAVRGDRGSQAAASDAATQDTTKLAAARPSDYFDPATLALCWSMTKQGLLKHVLTEGDKLAVAKFASLEDQGGYALASNYGSLVARLLFSPIEDTTRLLFAQSLHSIEPAAEETESKGVHQARTSMSLSSLDEISRLVSTLLRVHLILGMLFICFGAPLATAFLYIMAGPRWALGTSASAILGAYTWYIPVMAINGITEGFLQSTASKAQVERYSKVLIAASVSFAASLWLSQAIPPSLAGATGGTETLLVWANAFGLGIRALYCWSFLVRYFGAATKLVSRDVDGAGVDAKGAKRDDRCAITERLRPSSTLPSAPVLLSFGAVFVLLRQTTQRLMPGRETLLSATGGRLQAMRLLVPTLAFGVACLVFLLGVW